VRGIYFLVLKLSFYLFLAFTPKTALADCIVDTVQFDTSSTDNGNPITLAEIASWDNDGDGDDVSTCDVSHLTSLTGAFSNNLSFNQDISSWDVSNVTNFRLMFRSARSFNQDISSWDVSSATDMSSMFEDAAAFNQDISSWNVYNVTSMNDMFRANTVFNKDITGWNTFNVTNYTNMFRFANAMSTAFSADSDYGNTPNAAFFSPVELNSAPVANAGSDQSVQHTQYVTLNGTSSSDADNDSLTYSWTQTSGTSVTLSSSTASQPTFTAPTLSVGASSSTLVFSLVVNDGTVNSSADTVSITVNAPSTSNECSVGGTLYDIGGRTGAASGS
jgi:surface protein